MRPGKPIAPPKGLPAAGVPLWRSVTRHWAADHLVPDARELRLLEDACREAAMQTMLENELDEEVAAGKLKVKGSMGQPVVNTLVAECRKSRAQVAALLNKLDMSAPAEQTPGAGKMSAAEAGRRGGFAKHHGDVQGLG